MLSRGGKIEYKCPNCDDGDIVKIIQYGQISGLCHNCRSWWPWRQRVRYSLKKKCKI